MSKKKKKVKLRKRSRFCIAAILVILIGIFACYKLDLTSYLIKDKTPKEKKVKVNVRFKFIGIPW